MARIIILAGITLTIPFSAVFLFTQQIRNNDELYVKQDYTSKARNVFSNLANTQTAPSSQPTTPNTEPPKTAPRIINPTPKPKVMPEPKERADIEPVHGYQAKPYINVTQEYRTIYGSDRDEICTQLNLAAKKMDNGLTELGNIVYRIEYTYDPIKGSKGYSMGNFRLSTVSTITTPKLDASSKAGDETKKDFEVLRKRIVDHENEHQEILVKYATELVQSFNNMPYFDRMDTLKENVQNTYDTKMASMKKAQNDFDAQSRIGLDKFCEDEY